jgi:hypothetical protein
VTMATCRRRIGADGRCISFDERLYRVDLHCQGCFSNKPILGPS